MLELQKLQAQAMNLPGVPPRLQQQHQQLQQNQQQQAINIQQQQSALLQYQQQQAAQLQQQLPPAQQHQLTQLQQKMPSQLQQHKMAMAQQQQQQLHQHQLHQQQQQQQQQLLQQQQQQAHASDPSKLTPTAPPPAVPQNQVNDAAWQSQPQLPNVPNFANAQMSKGPSGSKMQRKGVTSSPSPVNAATPPNYASTPSAADGTPSTPKSPAVPSSTKAGKGKPQPKKLPTAKRRLSKTTPKLAAAEVPLPMRDDSSNVNSNSKRPREEEDSQPIAEDSPPKRVKVEPEEEMELKREADVQAASESLESSLAFADASTKEVQALAAVDAQAPSTDSSMFDIFAEVSKIFSLAGINMEAPPINPGADFAVAGSFDIGPKSGDSAVQVKQQDEEFELSWVFNDESFVSQDEEVAIGETPELMHSGSSQGPTPNSDGEGDAPQGHTSTYIKQELPDHSLMAGAQYYLDESTWDYSREMKSEGEWPITSGPIASGSL